jgi:hypothetical protein
LRAAPPGAPPILGVGGRPAATTLYFNGDPAAAAGIFDGVCSSLLTVTEIAA